ncbi:hypothetical protein AB1Y20_011960 [Prymnesium parvum]|uniref:Sugar phosphate transporter domain-containing protein n=1 Tax=Prymnesium parvum TaxID=97485 RepID=A0AB34IM32_PRYPA
MATLEACGLLSNLTNTCTALLADACNASAATNASSVCETNEIEPSTTACIGLSALGGLLEVTSTMCLAYPEYKKKKGATYSQCQDRLMMVANLGLMGIASIAYIVGSWFGPVSLAVPTIMVSKLLCNQIIMGAVLRMDSFSREQQIGVYCITCAILTLPEIGPTDQGCIDAEALIFTAEAIIMELVLFGATIWCVVAMVYLARRQTPVEMSFSLLVFVTAQVVSAVINASVSKLFPLVGGVLLVVCLILAAACAAINVISLILAAKAVDQGLFVPLTTCSTLIVNMVTGLVVWDDANVITKWVSYWMVHLIMLLGISLLAPADVIEKFGIRKRTENYQRITMVRQVSVRHLSHTPHDAEMVREMSFRSTNQSFTNRSFTNRSFTNKSFGGPRESHSEQGSHDAHGMSIAFPIFKLPLVDAPVLASVFLEEEHFASRAAPGPAEAPAAAPGPAEAPAAAPGPAEAPAAAPGPAQDAAVQATAASFEPETIEV